MVTAATLETVLRTSGFTEGVQDALAYRQALAAITEQAAATSAAVDSVSGSVAAFSGAAAAAATTGNALRGMAAEATASAGAMDTAGASATQYSGAVTGLSAPLERVLGLSTDLTGASNTLATAEEKAAAGAALEAEIMGEAGAVVERLVAAKSELTISTNLLDVAERAQVGTMAAVADGATAQAAALRQVKLAQDEASGSLNAGANAAAASGASLQMPILATVALGAEAIKMGASFDAQMSKVEGFAGVAHREIAGLSADVLKISEGTGEAANKVAQGLYFARSAGFDTADAMTILDRSTRLATAGFTDSKVVVDASTSLLKSYGLSVADLAHTQDVMTATVTAGKMDIADYAASIGRVAPIAAAAGISQEEMGASIAEMTTKGLSASVAINAFRSIIQTLENPTKKTREEFAALGVSTDQVRASIKDNGLLETMQALIDKTGGNFEAVAKLFPTFRALTGALADTGPGTKDFQQSLDAITNSSGVSQRAITAYADTSEASIKRFTASGKAALIELGSGGALALQPLLDLMTKINNLGEQNGGFLAGLGRQLLESFLPAAAGINVTKAAVDEVTGKLRDATPVVSAHSAVVRGLGGDYGFTTSTVEKLPQIVRGLTGDYGLATPAAKALSQAQIDLAGSATLANDGVKGLAAGLATAIFSAGQATESTAAMAARVADEAASLNLSTTAAGSHAAALGVLNSAVATASKSTQDSAAFQHEWGEALKFAGLSADEQKAKLAGLDDIIKNGSESAKSAATSQKALDEAVRALGPSAAETARQAQALSAAFSEAKDNGDWSAVLTAFQGELGNSDIKVKQLHDDWAGMLHIPSQEELDLKARIADLTLTIDQQHAALSNSTPAAQHVAALQKIYDQAVLTGAKLSDQTKAKEALDLALSQTGPAGADAAATQQRIDKLEPERQGLSDQLGVLVDSKNAHEAHGLAVAAGNPPIAEQLRLLPPLKSATQDAVQPTKDLAGANTDLATQAGGAATKIDSVTSSLIAFARTAGATMPAIAGVVSGISGGPTSFPATGAGAPLGGRILSPVAQLGPDVGVTQKFGVNGEQGVDFGIPTVGSPLVAGGSGVVTKVLNEGQAGIGLSVTIKLDDGTLETIGHLSKAMVEEGDKVLAGVVIGKSGGDIGSPTSGVTTGPHTEVQIRTPSGQLIDPLTVLTNFTAPGAPAGAGATAAAMPAISGGVMTAVQIAAALHANGIPDNMLGTMTAILLAENGGNTTGTSAANASGVGQLTPGFEGISEADRTGNSPEAIAAQFAAIGRGFAHRGPQPWNPWDYVGGGPPGPPNYGEIYVGPGKGSFNAFLPQGTAAANTVLSGAAGQAFTPGGVNPQPAPETPKTAAQVQAEIDAVIAGGERLDKETTQIVDRDIGQIHTVTAAELADYKTREEGARNNALDKIHIAKEAEDQLSAMLAPGSGATQVQIDSQKEVVAAAEKAATDATTAWKTTYGELTKEDTWYKQQTLASQAAITQGAIDAANGQRAITAEATEFFRVNDLDTMHGHERITEQIAEADQSRFDRAKQAALGSIADQITAQQHYNDAVLALDVAKVHGLVGDDLQVYQSAVDTAGKQLALASQTSGDLVKKADETAAKLIAANQSVEKDYEQGINRRISVGNQLYDINLKLADPNLSPTQRAALQTEAGQLPGLEDKLGQLQDALPRLRELEALAPAGSSLQQQYLDAIRQNIEAQNLATRAMTALGTAANDTGKTMSDADAAIINAGLAQVGGGHIMLASEVPSPAISRFWEVYGAAIANGASPAEATAAARSGASPTSSSQIAGAAVAAANPALDAAIAASKPLVDAVTATVTPNTAAVTAQTAATDANTAALNDNTRAQSGQTTGSGALAGAGLSPLLQSLPVIGPGGSLTTGADKFANETVPTLSTAGGNLNESAHSTTIAAAATMSVAQQTAAAAQQTVTGALTTAQGGHYLITSAGLVEDSAHTLGSASGVVASAGAALSQAVKGLPSAGGAAIPPGGTGISPQLQASDIAEGQTAAMLDARAGGAGHSGSLLQAIDSFNARVQAQFAITQAIERGLLDRTTQSQGYLASIDANTHDTTARLSVVTARPGQEAFFEQGLPGLGPTGFTAPAPATTPTNPQLAAIVQNTDQTAAAVQQTAAAVQENTAAINELASQQAETKLYLDSYLIASGVGRAIKRRMNMNLRPITTVHR